MFKRLVRICAVLVLMFVQVQGVFGSVNSVSAADNKVTVLDDADARVTVTPTVVDDRIDWRIDFDRHDPSDHTTRAIRIRVAQAENGSGTVVRRDGDLEQMPAPDEAWYHERDFSTSKQGDLVVSTDLDATQLVLWAQIDGKDMGGTVTKDLLKDEAAKPHTVQLPATVVQEVTNAKAAAKANADVPDTTTTADVEQPALPSTPQPATTDAGDKQAADTPATATDAEDAATVKEPAAAKDEPAATTEQQPATEPATDNADEQQPATDGDQDAAKDAGNVKNMERMDAPGTNQLDAINLRLLANASSQLKVDVSGANANTFTSYEKLGSSGSSSYGSVGDMRTTLYKEYPATGATAIIFNNRNANLSGQVTIDLDYDNVGTVTTKDGDVVDIGAYVKVNNIATHGRDWGGNSNYYGLDFSNNFYSGTVLGNVRSFDWEVIFYVKGDRNTRVNFGNVAGVTSQAQLTFTSLNPGEFVNALGGTDGQESYDTIHVGKYDFYANTLVGINKGNFETEYQRSQTGGLQTSGYTSHTWGEWNKNQYTNPNREWEDWSGAATFAKGAVAYNIVGNTFKFKRGSYGSSVNAWLALSSGSREGTIPKDLDNRKSVSSQAINGGGSPSMLNNATWTDNNLDGQLVNGHYPDRTFYYYINQQTYSLNDFLAKPNTIVIDDTLPAHLLLQEGARLFSDFTNGSSANAGMSINSNQINKETVDGREKLTITLTKTQIEALSFTGGYFTLRLPVKVGTDPMTVYPEEELVNRATVTMTPVASQEVYQKTTNDVTVRLGDRANGDITFNKVDGAGDGLGGAKFTLFNGDEEVQTATSADGNGQVTFADVKPGDYTIREAQAPDGFMPVVEVYYVTVNNDGTVDWTGGMPNDKQVINQLKPFTLSVKKVAAYGTRPLAGAKFELTDAQGNQLETQTTQDDGRLSFKLPLSPGSNYYVKELTAPHGFELNNNRIKVVVTANGIKASYVDEHDGDLGDSGMTFKYTLSAGNAANTGELTIENKPITPPTTDLPDTGSRAMMGYMIGGLLLVLVGGAWTLIQRRRGGDGHD